MSSSRTDVLVDVTMPQMGVSVAEGTVSPGGSRSATAIAADETICEISTDKIDTEVPAPVSGVVAEILVPVEATVAVGTVLARIAAGDGGGVGATAGADARGVRASRPPRPERRRRRRTGARRRLRRAAASAPADRAAAARPRRRYSPVVQRIAAEHGIDLSQVHGTGRDGRVRKQDVLAFVEAAPEPPLHIESPYRPEPVAPGAGAPAVSCRGCAARSAST